MSQEENSLLTAPYTEHEVRKEVFQMKHNKKKLIMMASRVLSLFLGGDQV
jgi:hypothetical protein